MQVFIIGTPLETARALSKRHLNNQINEAKIILDALNGAKAWSNHPCVLQYKGYELWLMFYKTCLEFYQRGNIDFASRLSSYGKILTPNWHTQEYYDQMKRRLYTKDPQHYAQFAKYGTSDYNLYYVDGVWRKYVNGKRVE